MPLIIPSADLRNNYNKISKRCHETKEPIYITKNGVNDLVVLSDEAFETIRKQNEKCEEERIEKLEEKIESGDIVAKVPQTRYQVPEPVAKPKGKTETKQAKPILRKKFYSDSCPLYNRNCLFLHLIIKA